MSLNPGHHYSRLVDAPPDPCWAGSACPQPEHRTSGEQGAGAGGSLLDDDPAGTDASTEPFPLQFPLSGRLVSSVMPAPVLAGDRWWGPSADRPCVATQLTLVLPPCTWHLFVIFLSSLFSSFTAGIAIEIVSVIHLF